MPGVDISHPDAQLNGLHRMSSVHAACLVDETDMRVTGNPVDLRPALVDRERQAEDVLVKPHRGGQVAIVEKRDGERVVRDVGSLRIDATLVHPHRLPVASSFDRA